MDDLEKYFLKLCEKHLEALFRGVDDLDLSSLIRGMIPRIENFNSKYKRLFYIRMVDFFGITILIQIDPSVPIPDTCGDGEYPFVRIHDEQQWIGILGRFYKKLKDCSDKMSGDPGSQNEINHTIKRIRGNMEIASSMWERYKGENLS